MSFAACAEGSSGARAEGRLRAQSVATPTWRALLTNPALGGHWSTGRQGGGHGMSLALYLRQIWALTMRSPGWGQLVSPTRGSLSQSEVDGQPCQQAQRWVSMS